MKREPSKKIGGSKGKWACFDCRLCFKETTTCPSCKQRMYDVGPRFKAPPRRDVREWAIMKVWRIDTLVLRNRSGIWLGHGPKQKTLREQKEQLAEDREYSYRHRITKYGRRNHSFQFPYVTFK
jgi:hypothetical protein